jgi:acetyl-CoA carboxylase carboxyl transferase subunit alpha
VIDEILPEPPGGAHSDPDASAERLRSALIRHVDALVEMPIEQLVEIRYDKYRRMGAWT